MTPQPLRGIDAITQNQILPRYDPTEMYYRFFEHDKPSTDDGERHREEPQKSWWQNTWSLLKSKMSLILGQPLLDTKPISEQSSHSNGSPAMQRVVLLGVHGWFPATWVLQTVVGELMGTSERLCLQLEQACRSMGITGRLHSIPLTGHGTVQDRVQECMTQLQAHSSTLHEADLILVAAHSQGVPTAVLLLDELVRSGMLPSDEQWQLKQRLGVLCMAGIAQGPFPGLQQNIIVQYVEANAARELFDFCCSPEDPTAPGVVREFWAAMTRLLSVGARMTLVASWLDQLSSALMNDLSHPNLFRSVYIDHHNYADDFLSGLVAFLVGLRNQGVDDYALLLQHLSEPLSGSLYKGVEHSTIYKDVNVYREAIQWTLNCQPRPGVGAKRIHAPRSVLNPFFIPWAMAHMTTDRRIQSDPRLVQELDQLIQRFDAWAPTFRVLKELRYRLEPLRSRL